MRRSLVITILLLSVASVAQAHSIVSVVLQPALFMSVGVSAETIGASFPWDPTTRTLSNFVVTTQGPLPAFSRRIQLLDFSNAEGDLFQLDYAVHNIFPLLGSVPGTYVTDLALNCVLQGSCVGEHFTTGSAKVTAVTAATEPGTLSLVGLGLAALLLRKRKKPTVVAKWESLG